MAVLNFILRGEFQQNLPRPRIFRDRMNPLDIYDDVDLIARFRMPRHLLLEVIGLVEEDISPPTNRSHAIPAALQVMCALRYYATGSFQKASGDIVGISQPSVSRIVHRVSRAICRNGVHIIHFPRTPQEQRRIVQGFYDDFRFPNTLGCVDGSLIRIKAPPVDENVYVCRKQYHALNIQGICDHRMKFVNMVARWPGSTHDAFIWNNCRLSEDFADGRIQGHLLGDSAYPLRPWLMTPMPRPRNDDDERYNRRHRRARQLIECTFGRWKMRWLAIHDFGGAMTLKPNRCIAVIVATAILHNICQEHGVPLPEDAPPNRMENPDADNNPPINDVGDAPNEGRLARDALIRGHFRR